MKRSLAILALALLTTSALAADNAVIVTPGAGVTMRTTDVGSLVQSPNVILSSITGAAIYGTAGTANANVLSVQGIASMTPLLVTATQSGGWTVAATQSGTWNITNVSGTVSLPTGASTSANQPSAVAAAGAATSGSTGNLAMGAVTTASPTYTTANSNPLSLDTAGNLRVNVVAGGAGGGAVTVANGADVTQGNTTDTVCATPTSATACTEIGLLKSVANSVSGPLPTQASTVSIGGVGLVAGSIGGCTGQVILTAASNNATQIKASAGTLCSVRWENTTTSVFSIRFYDTATAPSAGAPCNSATNVVANDVAQSNATSPGGVANLGPYGQAFASGIVVCVTGANANNDNTNAATGLNLNLSFK